MEIDKAAAATCIAAFAECTYLCRSIFFFWFSVVRSGSADMMAVDV